MRMQTSVWMLALVAVAGPLTAQQPGGMGGMQHGMGMMDSMMTPMMQAMAATPAHLLAAEERLGLTSQQQAQLASLRDAAQRESDAAAAQAAMHLHEMVAVMRVAQPDTATVKLHFQAAMRFMADAHWALVRAGAQAWPLLSATQQQQVVAMADSMRMGDMMGPGDMHRP